MVNPLFVFVVKTATDTFFFHADAFGKGDRSLVVEIDGCILFKAF
jgi:hypothetical protein